MLRLLSISFINNVCIISGKGCHVVMMWRQRSMVKRNQGGVVKDRLKGGLVV